VIAGITSRGASRAGTLSESRFVTPASKNGGSGGVESAAVTADAADEPAPGDDTDADAGDGREDLHANAARPGGGSAQAAARASTLARDRRWPFAGGRRTGRSFRYPRSWSVQDKARRFRARSDAAARGAAKSRLNAGWRPQPK
jgi:hypothetical protein